MRIPAGALPSNSRSLAPSLDLLLPLLDLLFILVSFFSFSFFLKAIRWVSGSERGGLGVNLGPLFLSVISHLCL